MEDNTHTFDAMDELDILAGPYLELYWDDFMKFENEVRHVNSWSWGAFFLGFFWFVPRRLYGLAFISAMLVPTFIVIASLFHTPLVLLLLYASWMIIRGKYGKPVFYNSLKRKAREAAALHDPSGNPAEYLRALRRMAITDSNRTSGIIISVVFGFFLFGLLMAIIIPNQLKYCAKSKQSEAKTNLKGIFTAEISFYGEHERYGNSFDEIGFGLAGGSAKVYTFGLCADRIGHKDPAASAKIDELATGFDNVTSFRAFAVGNMDSDPTLDVWAIDHNNCLTNLVNDVNE